MLDAIFGFVFLTAAMFGLAISTSRFFALACVVIAIGAAVLLGAGLQEVFSP